MNEWDRFNEQFREDEDERNERLRRKRKARAISAAEWNKTHHPGCGVVVTLDNGTRKFTKTRSEAWELGHGQPVVMLEGISGGYDLARVAPLEIQDTPLA